MKKVFRVALIIGLIITVCIAPVFAAIHDTWGPNWYTPYTGEMYAGPYSVAARKLYWSSSSLATYVSLQEGTGGALVDEFEFRPNGVHPIDLWQNPSSSNFVSNFPSAYYEFESGTTSNDNDVSVCCGFVAVCSSSTAYYGKVYLSPQSNANFISNTLQFESEYGEYLFIDAWPLQYEVYEDMSAVSFDTAYPW